ncbi:MAG TPA: hypothetical protein VKQ32_06435, partial [Polyangia bacterium]|nr:hypothetical protein [Polyangia bacterium]
SAGAAGSGTGAAGTTGAAGAVGSGGTTGAAGSSGTTGSAGTTGTGGSATGVAGRGGATGAGGAGTGGTAGTGTGGARGGAGGTGGASGTAGSGGSNLFTITVQLASAMKSTAPTTVGIVTWSISVSGVTAAHIDFGLDTTYGMTAPVDLTATNYRTLLLGMKPAKTYHFRIVATAGANTYMSNDQTVTTGAKLSSTPITSFSVKNAAAVPRGFFITSFWQGTGSNVPFIFDTDGDIVWWYTAASSESTDGISRARMSADSQSIWLVNESLSGNVLRRVTMDALTTQSYANTKASHDIAAVSGDTMAYLDYGEPDCNSIFEINNAGTTKEVFEPTNVTSMGTGMSNCHGNAVRYSKKEDFYTYSDWQHELAVVNRMGVLQWKLTQKVSGGNAAWGGAQHGHQLLDSSIILFANNGTAGGNRSQAIEYGLDGHLIKAFSSQGGATNFGDVQRLSNGNTIITYSTSRLMEEVDANDTVVLQVMGAGSFGYVEFRDSLYGPPLDIAQ